MCFWADLTRMRGRLQISLMASFAAASFTFTLFSPLVAHAQAGSQSAVGVGAIAASRDESGRTIYVNDDAQEGGRPSVTARSEGASRSRLVYWSATEHRFKPVSTSGAVMRAARSAASEVSTYLGGEVRNYGRLNRAFTQQEIDAAIDEAAARHRVDAGLVRSVIKVESNFNPNAVSPKGAMGLMQLMPSTVRSLNVANPFDPAENVDAGVRHLKKLLDSYGGNVRLSLAAYNAGAGAVARSAGVPRFRETQNYVRRITDLYGGEGSSAVVSRAHHAMQSPVHIERDSRGVLYISNTE